MQNYLLLLLGLLWLLPSPVMAWGARGHTIVCDIALNNVSEQTRHSLEQASRRMGYKHFSKSCSWADHIRSQKAYKWAKSLHYINVPRYRQQVNLARDCPPVSGRPPLGYTQTVAVFPGCVLSAIEYFQARWLDTSLTRRQRDEALLFLAHFIADVHQPLHVSYQFDRGGNRTSIDFKGMPVQSLHALWDNSLLQCQQLSSALYTHNAVARDAGAKLPPVSVIQQAPLLQWADESLKVTQDIYTQLSRSLSWEHYCQRFSPHVKRRLYMAGLRLAQRLQLGAQ